MHWESLSKNFLIDNWLLLSFWLVFVFLLVQLKYLRILMIIFLFNSQYIKILFKFEKILKIKKCRLNRSSV